MTNYNNYLIYILEQELQRNYLKIYMNFLLNISIKEIFILKMQIKKI